MQLLGADRSILIQQKFVLPYTTSSNNRIVLNNLQNNLQNFSLNPSVPQFLKCKSGRKGQKEARGKDYPAVPRRADTVIHTPQTMSCSDTTGAEATAAKTSFHTQHMLGKRVLASSSNIP